MPNTTDLDVIRRSAIAIDFGTGRTKVARLTETGAVELLRLGSDDRRFIPTYVGIEVSSEKFVIGEKVEALLEEQSEEKNVKVKWRDNLKREIEREDKALNIAFSKKRKRGGPIIKALELLTELFTQLHQRATEHPTFENGEPSTVFLTHSPHYSETHQGTLYHAAKKVFSDVYFVEEAIAASYMIRPEMGDLPPEVVLLDIGAGTVDSVYLRRKGDRYEPAGTGGYHTKCSVGRGGYDVDETLAQLAEGLEGNDKYSVDDALAELAKPLKGNAKNEGTASIRRQARLCKEEYCGRYQTWDEIKLSSGKTVELKAHHIQETIDKAFNDPLCQHKDFNEYIDAIKQIVEKEDRTEPIILLVGAGSRLTGLKGKLNNQFGLPVQRLDRSDFMVPLGAMHYGREDMLEKLQRSPRVSTADEEAKTEWPRVYAGKTTAHKFFRRNVDAQQSKKPPTDREPTSSSRRATPTQVKTKPDTPKDSTETPTETPPPGMVLIPAGEFLMGSNDSDSDALNDEKPEHTVYVDAFYMDEHPVTNAEYQKFVEANPKWRKYKYYGRSRRAVSSWGNALRDESKTYYLEDWKGNNYPHGEGDHPVSYVDWFAAMAYAHWAGKRLPTEAEWEKAARGGSVRVKRLGDDPNPYGLYMRQPHSEWCLDKYDANFYAELPHLNPIAPGSLQALGFMSHALLESISELDMAFFMLTNGLRDIPFEENHVVRGGRSHRIANRSYRLVEECAPLVCFRCVRSVSGSDEHARAIRRVYFQSILRYKGVF